MTLTPLSSPLLAGLQSRPQFLRTCMAAFTVHISHLEAGEVDEATDTYLHQCRAMVDLLHGAYQSGDDLDLDDRQLDSIALVLRHTRGKLSLKPLTLGPADLLQALEPVNLDQALTHVKVTLAGGPTWWPTGGMQA